MNLFFGIVNEYFKTEIQIPFFKNDGYIDQNNSLYKAYIKDNQWNLEKINKYEKKIDFQLIESPILDNSSIFFLGSDSDIKVFDKKKLKKINN